MVKPTYTFNSIIPRYQITRHNTNLDGYINHILFIQLFPEEKRKKNHAVLLQNPWIIPKKKEIYSVHMSHVLLSNYMGNKYTMGLLSSFSLNSIQILIHIFEIEHVKVLPPSENSRRHRQNRKDFFLLS